jgi:hypothetical protein
MPGFHKKVSQNVGNVLRVFVPGRWLGLLQPPPFPFQQVVKLGDQLVEFGGIFFLDDTIAERDQLSSFFGCHGSDHRRAEFTTTGKLFVGTLPHQSN